MQNPRLAGFRRFWRSLCAVVKLAIGAVLNAARDAFLNACRGACFNALADAFLTAFPTPDSIIYIFILLLNLTPR